MRKFMAVAGVTLVGVLLLPPPAAADPVVPVLDQAFQPVEEVRAFYLSESPLWAQTFTVGLTGTMTYVDAYVEKVAYTTDPLRYAIATYSGGGVGSLLTQGAVDTSVIFPSFAWLRFDTHDLAVTQGDTLALVLWANEAIAPYVWKGSTIGGYAGGELLTGDFDTFKGTGYDAGFRTYVSESVPEPSVLALFGLGSLAAGLARRSRRRQEVG